MCFALAMQAACGSGLAPEGHLGPPLATITTAVDPLDVGIVTTELRAVLLWPLQNPLPGGPFVLASETPTNIAANTARANGMVIQLFEPPPATVLRDGDGGALFALGSPLLYADTNQNGRFDLPESIDGPLVDEIVATTENVSILFVANAPLVLQGRPSTAAVAFEPGLSQWLEGWVGTGDHNLWLAGDCEAEGREDLCFDEGFPLSHERPVGDTIFMSVFSDLLNADFCRQLEKQGPVKRPPVECDADNRGYRELCDRAPEGLSRHCWPCDTFRLLPNEEMPPHWPCPE